MNSGDQTILQAEALSKSYAQRRGLASPEFRIQALESVDLDIPAGKTTAVVGKSGSGKSTLGRCLAGLERPDTGRIRFQGEIICDSSHAPGKDIRTQIQLLFQDSSSALNPWMTVEEILREPLHIQKRTGQQEQIGKIRALMERVGLASGVGGQSPRNLSGGQRQRVAIARALALEPKVLILDESLSGLDLSSQAQMLNLLLDLQDSFSLTYIFITHDLVLTENIADFVVILDAGKVIEKASSRELFRNPKHPRTQELLSASTWFRWREGAKPVNGLEAG